ncbi:MAG: three-Cys-motif partner protein TcmP [Chloroflexota bacterium]
MATPKETVWKIDPHTLAKHEILRRYLAAWFPILLSKRHKRVIYIDGFAGPGRYNGGEIGSPIIALQEAMKQGQRLQGKKLTFLFMDAENDRIEHLKTELANLSIPDNFNINTVAGEFDIEFKALLDYVSKEDRQLAPTFAFIDPFGFKGLPFELVKRLLEKPQTEVFINLMADSINRFLTHPDHQTTQHIIDLFGTPEVLDVAQNAGDRLTNLRLLYQKQLKNSAQFVRFFEMKNKHNRTIYYLFFATNHPLGHKKMKEAFWKVDASSGFIFSDQTNPNQLVLFEHDESAILAKEIYNHFLNRRVSVEHIEKYVEDETSFLSKHMRSALRQLETENKIRVDEYKKDGNRRRKGSFPNTVTVQFVQTLF